MKRLAIVGSGIAGMASAYFLRGRYDIEVFEKDERSGGHTNTVTVDDPAGPLGIDTGFIVHNPANYPGLIALFAELGVETKKSDMSFSMQNYDSGLEFSGEGLSGLFAQKKNLFSPRYLKFLLEANRFNTRAPHDARSGLADTDLRTYLEREGYSDFFTENFIYPMASAVWSTPADLITDFHAESFIRFFMNHGFLGLSGGQEWRTVKGGSNEYMKKIAALLGRPVRTGDPVLSVRRTKGQVEIISKSGKHLFDAVILAGHADESLSVLKDASSFEQSVLSAFQYQRNRALLHRDESVMPSLRRLWASWNYRAGSIESGMQTSTVYYMNRLQRLDSVHHYFVSINEFRPVDPQKVLYSIEYTHPLFNSETVRRQRDIPALNQSGPVYFAGSYHGYGFHEDAFQSARAVAERLL